MEKLVYAVWKSDRQPQDEFHAALRTDIPRLLGGEGAQRLQLTIANPASLSIATAHHAHFAMSAVRPLPDAIVSFWLTSAHVRAPHETILRGLAPRIAGYAVSELTVIPYREAISEQTGVTGFSQVALILLPPRLPRDGFLDIWLGSQTRIAVETQSNFYYCQNIINRVMTHGAPPWVAIVEEWFPMEALSDPRAFYDAVGNDEKFAANVAAMSRNVDRFVDGDKIDFLACDAYRPGGWTD